MGEIAALLTSCCWSLTSLQFTLAGQRVGSEIVNRTRLILAVAFLSFRCDALDKCVAPERRRGFVQKGAIHVPADNP